MQKMDLTITRQNFGAAVQETAAQVLSLIRKSPTAFHAVQTASELLSAAGYTEIQENRPWRLEAGGRYFVTRNGSSVISFRIPGKDFRGYRIIAAHSDSPAFKIKENPEMKIPGFYVKLNTERYGGMLMNPWFDRPLSVAGRVVLRGGETRLVNIDRDLLMIPGLAIHMDREANKGRELNPQKDLLPVFAGEVPGAGAGNIPGAASAAGSRAEGIPAFMETVAAAAGCRADEILTHDLFLYDRTPQSAWGARGEFISSARLDDLECAFGSLLGFLSSGREGSAYVSMHAIFDNEEVGSMTKQGADSTFLEDTLRRIGLALGRTEEQYYMAVADSFMVSADNAHAVHPNFPEKADPVNRPRMNGGIVLKYSANQKYTTDAVSGAFIKEVCAAAGVPCQVFTNRSDMIGGSTLGNISGAHVSVRTADIGLAQLAMHSPYETAGALDPEYLKRFAGAFYRSE